MTTDLLELEAQVDGLYDASPDKPLSSGFSGATDTIEAFISLLEGGQVRAATRAEDGKWVAVPWVKRGILLAFRFGSVVATTGSEGGGCARWCRFGVF